MTTVKEKIGTQVGIARAAAWKIRARGLGPDWFLKCADEICTALSHCRNYLDVVPDDDSGDHWIDDPEPVIERDTAERIAELIAQGRGDEALDVIADHIPAVNLACVRNRARADIRRRQPPAWKDASGRTCTDMRLDFDD
jgi:hypothetical protein